MGKTQSFSLKAATKQVTSILPKQNSRNMTRSSSSLNHLITKSTTISNIKKLRNPNNLSLSSSPQKVLNLSQSVEEFDRTATSFQLLDQTQRGLTNLSMEQIDESSLQNHNKRSHSAMLRTSEGHGIVNRMKQTD